jgi:hypothetical protein
LSADREIARDFRRQSGYLAQVGTRSEDFVRSGENNLLEIGGYLTPVDYVFQIPKYLRRNRIASLGRDKTNCQSPIRDHRFNNIVGL